MKINYRFSSAFTIVELAIVIVVIGILAGITAIGYGNWQESLAKKAVQSDLRMAAAAMESAKNFSQGYPAAIPANFKQSSSVTVTYYSGNDTTFCIDGASVNRPDVHYFIDVSFSKEPVAGTCEYGEEASGTGVAWKPGLVSAQEHTCAIAAGNGTAYCWGLGTNGRLGSGSTSSSSTPVAVSTSGVLAGKTIKAISAATTHTCAIASDDNAYCWGGGGSGQLGTGSTSDSSTPVAVSTSGVLAGKTIKAISVGGGFSCAIASDDNAYCWGYNTYGAIGNNNIGVNAPTPVAVDTTGVLSGKSLKSISAGLNHVCVVATDDNAYCWGYNSNGQLGNSGTSTASVPVAVDTSGALSGKGVKAISNGGTSHTCAIASDNLPYCWGYGLYGRLGNGGASSSTVPVAVTTSGALAGKTVRAITAAATHTCAISNDRMAYCWGQNTYGRLGDGTTNMSQVPVAVTTAGSLSGKTVKSISAGGNNTCAIASDNNAYCWGQNASGQFGNNTTTTSSVPTIANSP